MHGKSLVAALGEVPDRNAAEAIDGYFIGAPREAQRVRLTLLALLPLYLALALALNGLLPLQLQPTWAALEKLDGLPPRSAL